MVPRSVKKKITDGFNKNKTITNIDCFVHYSYNIYGSIKPIQPLKIFLKNVLDFLK